MAMKAGAVAVAFSVTPQTIRNWVNHPELSEFFSAKARRDNGRGQAEFLPTDLEVCNSIQVMLRQKMKWEEIAHELKNGWRDRNMPARLMVVDEELESQSSMQLMTALAAVNERNENSANTIQKYEETIADLRTEIEGHKEKIETLNERVISLEAAKAAAEARQESIDEIKKQERELGRMERELELMRAGRLIPSNTEGESGK